VKILLAAAVVLVALLASGLWALNRWLQLPETSARVERALADALGMPVKITKLELSVWNGAVAEGVSASDRGGTLFSATRVSASHKFTSLVRGKLVLDDVRVEDLRFRLVENAAGEWRMPVPAKENQPGAKSTPHPRESSPSQSETPPAVLIDRLRISNATLELIDKAKAPFATVTGFNGTIRDATPQSFTAEFDAARAVLHGWAAFENLKGTATHSDGTFMVRNLTADCGGGRATVGEFTYQEGTPTISRITLDHVSIERAFTSAGTKPPDVTGFISGDAQITGLGGDTKAVTARGTAVFKDANCRQIDLARQIAEILRLDTSGVLEFVEAKTNFQIASERVLLTPMDISAPPIGMSLTGSAGFDGTLALSANLNAPADFIEQRGLTAGQFSPPDQNRRRGVQFDIKGSLKKPKNNLAERVTGTKDKTVQKIMAAEAIISALAGKKKPKPKPEEPKIGDSPTPAQP
jgi:hypothetical protein